MRCESLRPSRRFDATFMGCGCRDDAMNGWSYESLERSSRDVPRRPSSTRFSSTNELAWYEFDARELEVSLPGELLT